MSGLLAQVREAVRTRHRIESGDDICTVQELLGRASVESTQSYTHVLNRGGRGVNSPLDDE